MDRWPVLAALVIVAGLLASTASPSANVSAQDDPAGPTRSVQLVVGWNLVAWTGNDASVQDALGETLAAVVSVNTFDAATQSFKIFTTEGPAFLNDLDIIAAGAGVWLLADAAATWEQPRVAASRDVPLVAGFNLVGWTGTDGAIVDALDGLGNALTTAFLWDAVGERFLTYAPAVPAFLNTADTVAYGDGLWVLNSAPAIWTQGGGEPETATTTSAGLELTHSLGLKLSIPAGAINPGVEVTATPVPLPTDLPDGATPIGTAYDITVNEVLGRPATLRFPLPAGADPDRIVVFRIDGDETMALSAELIGDEIVALTPGFSLLAIALSSRQAAAQSQVDQPFPQVNAERRLNVAIAGPAFLGVGDVGRYSAAQLFVSDPDRLEITWQLYGKSVKRIPDHGRFTWLEGVSTEQGSSTLALRIRDPRDGLTAFAAKTITVTETGSLSVSLSGTESLPIDAFGAESTAAFTATISTAAPGLYEISWTYGDGRQGGSAMSTSKRFDLPSHAYRDPGVFTVHVTVVHSDTQEAAASFAVDVRPPPLTAVMEGIAFLEVDPPLIEGGDTGPTRPRLYRARWLGAGIQPYVVNWIESVDMTIVSHRIPDDDPPFEGHADIRFLKPGLFVVAAQVIDGFGRSVLVSMIVTVEVFEVSQEGSATVTTPVDEPIIAGETVMFEAELVYPKPITLFDASENFDLIDRFGIVIASEVGAEVVTVSLARRDGAVHETNEIGIVRTTVQIEHRFDEPGTFDVFAVWNGFFRDPPIIGLPPIESGRFVRAVIIGDPVTIEVLPNVNGLWGSKLECEVEEPGFEFSWTVSLAEEDDGSVEGTIFFHACPGGGRVSYGVIGQVEVGGPANLVTLRGTKKVNRGSLGNVNITPAEVTFEIERFEEPVPNFVKRHDIAVSVVAETKPVYVERPVEYKFTLTNSGPDSALEPFLRLEWGGVPATLAGDPSCAFESGILTCRRAQLAVGATWTLIILLTPQDEGELSVEANVGAAGADPAFGNNRKSATTTVFAPPK